MGVNNATWEEALKDLRGMMPDFLFQNFFRDTEPFFATNGVFYFEVQNEREKVLFETKHKERVRLAIMQASKRLGEPSKDIDVIYMTPDEVREFQEKTFAPAPRKSAAVPSDAKKNASKDSVPQRQLITLSPQQTFESFVVGESNKFAHAAALAVANAPGKTYNPLFLYGGVGLGKTHLMHAIGNQILAEHPDMKIVYVTSETFTNELISMIKSASNNVDRRQQFRDKYRKADVLMIDDIQFIAGKDTTQDEFFHTFNELHHDEKQIVLSSDRPPKDLSQLEERMRSRFEMGLIADIQQPDYETRVAILMKKASERPDMRPIQDEAFYYMAEQSETNIRKLEGALQRVLVYAKLNNIPVIEASTAKEALQDVYSSATHKAVSSRAVCHVVSEYYGVEEKDILGRRRPKNIAWARQVAMYMLRTMADMTLEKIAEIFSRDHTTVMHGVKKVEDEMNHNVATRKEVEDIAARLRNS